MKGVKTPEMWRGNEYHGGLWSFSDIYFTGIDLKKVVIVVHINPIFDNKNFRLVFSFCSQ